MAKRVVVIGSGFAALTAVKELRRKCKGCEITVVAPTPEFVYAPSLIWIPTGLRQSSDLKRPLEPYFKKKNIRYVRGKVCGLENGGRTVVTEEGRIENDALIIASGGRFLKTIPGTEYTLTLCEGVSSAEEIRRRVQDMSEGGVIAFGFAANPQEVQALRGGPIFELAFGVDTWLRRQGLRDKFTLTFFSPAPKPGIRLGERAYNRIVEEMKHRGIEIASLGQKILRFEPNKIVTEEAEIEADLILFMPGLTGPAWLKDTALPLSVGGMIRADAWTRVEGFSHVYAAGDCASYESPDWAPKQAHMADLQAAAAAANALDELDGKPARATFRWELICLVDCLDKGILVFRNQRLAWVMSSRVLHGLKRVLEYAYMRQYT